MTYLVALVAIVSTKAPCLPFHDKLLATLPCFLKLAEQSPDSRPGLVTPRFEGFRIATHVLSRMFSVLLLLPLRLLLRCRVVLLLLLRLLTLISTIVPTLWLLILLLLVLLLPRIHRERIQICNELRMQRPRVRGRGWVVEGRSTRLGRHSGRRVARCTEVQGRPTLRSEVLPEPRLWLEACLLRLLHLRLLLLLLLLLVPRLLHIHLRLLLGILWIRLLLLGVLLLVLRLLLLLLLVGWGIGWIETCDIGKPLASNGSR